MDSTNHTNREELRELDQIGYEHYRCLLDLIYNAGATGQDHYKLKDQVDRHIVAIFNKQLAKATTEARIDELQNRLKVQFISSHWNRLCNEVNSWAKYVDCRITQLSAQKKGDSYHA